MPNKKSTEKEVRKLTKVGKQSIAVTIPIEIIRELGWQAKQKVIVRKSGSKLIIEDWR